MIKDMTIIVCCQDDFTAQYWQHAHGSAALLLGRKMKIANEKFSVDYLIRTLATAYLGVITSLRGKDFCTTEEGNSVTLKGTGRRA